MKKDAQYENLKIRGRRVKQEENNMVGIRVQREWAGLLNPSSAIVLGNGNGYTHIHTYTPEKRMGSVTSAIFIIFLLEDLLKGIFQLVDIKTEEGLVDVAQ